MDSVIKNDEQYYQCLERIEEIFDAKPGTKTADELELLSLLVEKYEEDKYQPTTLDPLEVIEIRMRDLNLKQVDLVSVIGNKGNVSQILRGNRQLTVNQIRKLSYLLKVPVELLVGSPVEVG